jgi:hypothetical protein
MDKVWAVRRRSQPPFDMGCGATGGLSPSLDSLCSAPAYTGWRAIGWINTAPQKRPRPPFVHLPRQTGTKCGPIAATPTGSDLLIAAVWSPPNFYGPLAPQ